MSQQIVKPVWSKRADSYGTRGKDLYDWLRPTYLVDPIVCYANEAETPVVRIGEREQYGPGPTAVDDLVTAKIIVLKSHLHEVDVWREHAMAELRKLERERDLQ